ncbi:hypothetical protein ILYODFUR_037445 [Ilyodon furcidens]|uniref:Uncharacterized protein n=1 Tax=Ilyodon furcidens TaxID=33524 RepID=A0ABV0TQH6_9TELE
MRLREAAAVTGVQEIRHSCCSYHVPFINITSMTDAWFWLYLCVVCDFCVLPDTQIMKYHHHHYHHLIVSLAECLEWLSCWKANLHPSLTFSAARIGLGLPPSIFPISSDQLSPVPSASCCHHHYGDVVISAMYSVSLPHSLMSNVLQVDEKVEFWSPLVRAPSLLLLLHDLEQTDPRTSSPLSSIKARFVECTCG